MPLHERQTHTRATPVGTTLRHGQLTPLASLVCETRRLFQYEPHMRWFGPVTFATVDNIRRGTFSDNDLHLVCIGAIKKQQAVHKVESPRQKNGVENFKAIEDSKEGHCCEGKHMGGVSCLP